MQNITQSWFVQGMIKATTDAWLKGWDERNGGNLYPQIHDRVLRRSDRTDGKSVRDLPG